MLTGKCVYVMDATLKFIAKLSLSVASGNFELCYGPQQTLVVT